MAMSVRMGCRFLHKCVVVALGIGRNYIVVQEIYCP